MSVDADDLDRIADSIEKALPVITPADQFSVGVTAAVRIVRQHANALRKHDDRQPQHRWTAHGHACCRDAKLSASSRPASIARCGGPAICKNCAMQAGQIHARS